MSTVRARADASDIGPRTAGTALSVVVDEQAWVRRIRAGDDAAFEELFHVYYGPLWAYAFGLVDSPEVAEECVQDVLFRVWAQRDGLAVRDTLRGYLYAAVRNDALNLLKRERVTARWAERAAHEPGVRGTGTGPAPADEWLHAHELETALGIAIAALPPRRREAVTLRWQHRLTNAHVARVMGVSVKAVEGHLAAALETLRAALGPLLGLPATKVR